MARKKTSQQPTIRCAIYTRVSTDERLDMDFNSLDAQRESAEAYVASQKAEGWIALPDRYDDAGFSGGTLDRPALQRLLSDVDEGKVDNIVCYKVDRLSRSLLDFGRIMERLEAKNVSFVSVTQQFNSAHSMGRLTLNILLSFSQFEREIIAERTRDKMRAARKKGKYTGGMPVLGYDVDPAGGRLVVNESEAERVRDIFALYLTMGGLVPTVQELNRRGWMTKRHVARNGRSHGGRPFTKTNLHHLLSNATYSGQVRLDGELYPGEHDAIVEMDLWNRVQEKLRSNSRNGGATQRNRYGALLRGLLFCEPCDRAMIHVMAKKGSRRYRYYRCTTADKQGAASCPSGSLPALEIERFVVDQIRELGKDEGVVADVLRHVREAHDSKIRQLSADLATAQKSLRGYDERLRELAGAVISDAVAARKAEMEAGAADAQTRISQLHKDLEGARAAGVDEKHLRSALSAFDPVWDEMTPVEQARIVHLLVERVDYHGGRNTVAVTFRPLGIRTLTQEATA